MGSNNSSPQSTSPVDPANCRCRNTDVKYFSCECGRSKPSNDRKSSSKIRFYIDYEKARKGESRNIFDIPEHAKTDKDRANDRDPEYQALIRDLRSHVDQSWNQNREAKK